MNWAAERTALLAELLRVLAVLPVIEVARRLFGPGPAIKVLRGSALRKLLRDSAGRQRLHRAVGWVDRHLWPGANCYRRVLLQVALDRGVAAEPVYFGLKLENDRLDGHAWLSGQTVGESFPVILQL